MTSRQLDRIILASASPRRAELLRAAGIDFDVRPADVDEAILPGEAPSDYVSRLAEAKARVVHERNHDRTVLAADTAVVVDGGILGKPIDEADAHPPPGEALVVARPVEPPVETRRADLEGVATAPEIGDVEQGRGLPGDGLAVLQPDTVRPIEGESKGPADELGPTINLDFNTGLGGVAGFLIRLRHGGTRWFMVDTPVSGSSSSLDGALGSSHGLRGVPNQPSERIREEVNRHGV